jgi:hypothetical protein
MVTQPPATRKRLHALQCWTPLPIPLIVHNTESGARSFLQALCKGDTLTRNVESRGLYTCALGA